MKKQALRRFIVCGAGMWIGLHSAVQAQSVTAPRTMPNAAQTECLFRWAQDRHPSYFRTTAATTHTTPDVVYRHYDRTNTYLGINRQDNHLYFLAPQAGSGPLDLGSANDWLEASACRDPYAPVQNAFDDVPVASLCDPSNPVQNCAETHAKAIRIDDEADFGFAKTEFDAGTNTLKVHLEPAVSLNPRFEVGAYVYRSRKDRKPLIHRIDSLVQQGQTVTFVLSKVNAKEVFPRARIRARIPLSTAAATTARATIASAPRALSTPEIGPTDCSGNVFAKSFADPGGPGKPAVQGSVTFDLTACHFRISAWIDAVLEWDVLALDVDKVEVSLGGDVDAAMDTKLQLELSGAYSASKSIWQGETKTQTLGPIVITITPELYAGYELSGKANLTSLQGFTWKDSIALGVGYNDASKWYPIDERSNTFTHYGPNITFDANVTVKPWLEYQTNYEAFGVVGGTISAQGFAQGKLTGSAKYVNGTLTGDMCSSLDVGLTPRAGVIVELLGADIFAKDWPLFTFQKTVVSNACISYSGKAPSIPADADPKLSSCFVDSECTQPEDSTLSATCQKDGPTSGGLYRYICKTNVPSNYCKPSAVPGVDAATCDDKNRYTTDICNTTSHRCENVVAENLSTSATSASTSPINTSALCKAPGCCYLSSDCADGDANTTDVCEKSSIINSPSVKGVCKSTSRFTVPR